MTQMPVYQPIAGCYFGYSVQQEAISSFSLLKIPQVIFHEITHLNHNLGAVSMHYYNNNLIYMPANINKVY